MSEELYNSNDYCTLAEELEQLKLENKELLADKMYLINAAMDGGDKYHYAAHDIGYRDLERKCKALEADYVISNRELLVKQVEIDRLTADNACLTAELEREKDNCGKFYIALEKIYDALGMDDHTGSCIPEIDKLQANNARRDEIIADLKLKLDVEQGQVKYLDEIIARLKEDGERLASTYVIEVFPHEWVCRGGCHHWARFGEQIEHSPGCPITLHRALMKEINNE